MSYQDDNDRDADSSSDRNAYDDRDERYGDDVREQRERRERTSAPGLPPQKKGCSKGCLFGLAGCGCLTLLIFIGLGFVGWKFLEAFMKGTSTDPAVIVAKTADISDLTPPEGLEPKLAMNVYVARVVFYQSADGEQLLSVLQLEPWFSQGGAPANKEFADSFLKEFGDGGFDIRQPDLQIEKTETVDLKIRGQSTKVRFCEAKLTTGEEYRLIEAQFAGKGGPVHLRWTMPVKKFDQDAVKKFLESIK